MKKKERTQQIPKQENTESPIIFTHSPQVQEEIKKLKNQSS